MTIELKNDIPEVKDLVHILNTLSKNEIVTLTIRDFTRDIRKKFLKVERDKKQLQDEIIYMYQNDNYSVSKIAEVFNIKKEEVVNILADNKIFCYDYDLKEEDKAISEIMEELKQ